MKIPFRKSKQQALAEAKPRDELNRFVATSNNNDGVKIQKGVEAEAKALGNTMQIMDSIYGMMGKQEALINAKVESILAAGYEPEGTESDGWMAVLAPVLQELAPHIAPYVGGLIEKYAGVSPNLSPQPKYQTVTPPAHETPSGGGINFADLINQAAKTNPTLLKAAMPAINNELTKKGIDPVAFKAAIQNLNRAI